MKNNHGWSLSEMVILSCILVGFLLLVVILINSLYSDIDKMNQTIEKNNGYTYTDVEDNLKKAAKAYHKKNKTSYMVTSDELIEENYLEQDELKPNNEKKACIGYVTITKEVNYEAFISCENYESEGY